MISGTSIPLNLTNTVIEMGTQQQKSVTINLMIFLCMAGGVEHHPGRTDIEVHRVSTRFDVDDDV
uniref:Uncharacterized protein n=1 Tax=Ciona intestinalis TaxID=7719 RepID=H2XSW3_CIOIN